MDGDHLINSEQACDLQAEAQQSGILLMWTVTHNTADYGNLWTARPQAIQQGKIPISFPFVLLADTLEDLRASLPPNLDNITRAPADDPVIVEVWL